MDFSHLKWYISMPPMLKLNYLPNSITVPNLVLLSQSEWFGHISWLRTSTIMQILLLEVLLHLSNII